MSVTKRMNTNKYIIYLYIRKCLNNLSQYIPTV